MKVAKRAKRRVERAGPTPAFQWIPVGYYRNRPRIWRGMSESGVFENVRFIESSKEV